MDIVIPLGEGSKCFDLELKFALRSLARYVQDVQTVWIVGKKRSWLQGVDYLDCQDRPGHSEKEGNIYRKLCKACVDPRVSDNFLYFQDDHFLLAPWTGKIWRGGKVLDRITQLPGYMGYRQTLLNTMLRIDELRIAQQTAVLDFDIHCPLEVNKRRFQLSVGSLPWSAVMYGFCIKTAYIYLNGFQEQGEYCQDLKIRKPHEVEELFRMTRGRPWFSCDDPAITGKFVQVLQALYPDPSPWELPGPRDAVWDL